MKKRVLAIIVLVVMVFTVTAVTVVADSWAPPEPFEIYSADGARVFRFTPDPNWAGDNANHAAATVYDVDSGEVIYTVNGFRSHAYEHNFFFTEDLMFFAFMPPTDFRIAIEFYANGEPFMMYEVRNLVRDHTQIRRTTSTIWWRLSMDDGGTEFSSENNTLTVVTADHLRYVFDITDGSVIEGYENLRSRGGFVWFVIGIAVIGIVVISVSVGTATWKRK